MSNMSDLQGIDEDIISILNEYMKVPSFTNTENEKLVDLFFNKFISSIDYFKENPSMYGQYKIINDSLGRSVNYALLKGDVDETVVLLHHSDIVNIDNYSEHMSIAFDSIKLEEAFLESSSLLDEESLADLYSGKWIFGRGTADMKAGGAIQLALLKHYANSDVKIPNILLIAVPDEENQSLGMRSAVLLLEDLKNEYLLDYKLIINSEPHQRLNDDRGVISQGSIAKMNIFVHVKGVLAHAGKALEGLNPNGLMGKIVSEIDLSSELVDYVKMEMSIPPTWVYLRDSKKYKDISFPISSYGVLNVLNFSSTPEMVLDKIKKICKQSFEEYICSINDKRREFSKVTGRSWEDLKWDNRVLTFSEFLEFEGIDRSGIKQYPEDLESALLSSDYKGPVIVIGLLPPYYPGVTNEDQATLHLSVNNFTKKMWSQEYDNRMYFTGISDLSYTQLNLSPKDINDQMTNMLGWKTTYDIPFDLISKLLAPCINIGPWGKDFHRETERVYKEDLMDRTPLIIDNLIKSIRRK